MKNRLFFNCSVLALSCCITTASAKDIYLSSKGKDAKDGLTPATAVSSLTKALEIADKKGDIIHVSGFIDVTKDSGNSQNKGIRFVNKDISLIGDTKEASGFDGKNKSKLFVFDGLWAKIEMKNLTLKNGNNEAAGNQGSAVYIRNSRPEAAVMFENCEFAGNGNPGDNANNTGLGGAVYQAAGNSSFKSCNFINNRARRGACIYIDGGKVNIENSVLGTVNVEDIPQSQGAGLFIATLQPVDISLKNSLIKDCNVTFGGAAVLLQHQKAESAKLWIENCAIKNNSTLRFGGGALMISNDKAGTTDEINIINTTIASNTLKDQSNGGAILVESAQPGSTMDIINCTIVDNYTAGNAGHGPGIRFLKSNDEAKSSKNLKTRILNSILEANRAEVKNACGDISIQYDAPDSNCIQIENSFIGDESSRKLNKANYPTAQIGYRTTPDKPSASGIVTDYKLYLDNVNCIPVAQGADFRTFGNAKYLAEKNIKTDQLGNVRKIENGKCAVGAVEAAPDALKSLFPKSQKK